MTDSVNAPIPAAPPTGTIDITNTVESLKSSFITYATKIIMGAEATVPELAWMVTTPIVSSLDEFAIKEVVTVLANSVIMLAFFENTAIRKASQAEDFVAIVTAKNSLPSTASQEDFDNAEKNQMVAFRNFVMVTN